jgi:hypothetical protein
MKEGNEVYFPDGVDGEDDRRRGERDRAMDGGKDGWNLGRWGWIGTEIENWNSRCLGERRREKRDVVGRTV